MELVAVFLKPASTESLAYWNRQLDELKTSCQTGVSLEASIITVRKKIYLFIQFPRSAECSI